MTVSFPETVGARSPRRIHDLPGPAGRTPPAPRQPGSGGARDVLRRDPGVHLRGRPVERADDRPQRARPGQEPPRLGRVPDPAGGAARPSAFSPAAPGSPRSSGGCARSARARRRSRAASSAATVALSEAEQIAHELDVARRRALRTGLTIAGAIGVHNFAEGLAIGVSARAGAISLATVLIIGFAPAQRHRGLRDRRPARRREADRGGGSGSRG